MISKTAFRIEILLLIIYSLLTTKCEEREDVPTIDDTVLQRSDLGSSDLGNIWVLGDSWSACHGDNTWRRTLHQNLEASGYTFDFIGTETDSDPPCEPGQAFDRDHNAYGGITAVDLLKSLPDWYKQLPPADHVLLMAGGNDLAADEITVVLQTLTDMVTSLRSDNPNVVVFMGAYAYTSGAEATFVDQANQLISDLADAVSTTPSPVYYTDLRPNFDPSIHELTDEHPNAEGMAVLGDNWFAKIQEVSGQ